MRGSVIFDECGFLSEEMLEVYGAFAAVNKGFVSGKDRNGKMIDTVRLRTFATNIPNQKFYISSASSTDTKYYKLYREFAKRQLMGDRDYCVVQVSCDVVLKPTIRGEVVNALLKKSDIETAVRTNPEKARREYYCEFTSDAGMNAIIRRGVIARNSETRAPLLYNDTGKKKFIIAYDPARSRDNSVILVMEIYQTEDGQYKGRVVNCVNLLDVGKKIKSPMRTPDQIEYLKQLILDYNGDAPDYENIECVLIDAGSGGGGVNIADFMMEDWYDKKGKMHRGLIDKEYSEEYANRYPNAVNKLRLVSPAQYKSIIYEALIEMLDIDAISFTADYDNKGYLTVFEADEKKLEKEKRRISEELKTKGFDGEEFTKKLEEELSQASCVKTKVVKLDPFQEIALANIDALKEEMVNMVRKKRESGKDSFEITPEKANKLHDDRSYTMALCAWWLSEKRLENVRARKKPNAVDLINMLPVNRGKPLNKLFG